MKKKIIAWICIGAVFINLIAPKKEARASIFGEETVVLAHILIETIKQVQMLTQIVGRARETVSVLEEMNRGVKEVLRLADTAHIKLPKQVYERANQVDEASREAKRIYGVINSKSPSPTRTNYQSGVEALYLSQDAFEYSTYLDEQGRKVKSSALTASQASATRLTAQTMGVLLHAVSHSNRITAKQLELASTKRLEESAKENANFESFIETHDAIEREMKASGFMSLNPIGRKQ